MLEMLQPFRCALLVTLKLCNCASEILNARVAEFILQSIRLFSLDLLKDSLVQGFKVTFLILKVLGLFLLLLIQLVKAGDMLIDFLAETGDKFFALGDLCAENIELL